MDFFLLKLAKMMSSCLEVELLNEEGGQVPVRANPTDAGFDLFASKRLPECVIGPWERKKISTDIAVAVPPNTYGRIAPRSGLADKKGIHVGAGVVDEGYRGEIGIILFNLSDEPFVVKPGDRVAQLILEKIEANVTVKITKKLPDSKRGTAGFGSSGTAAFTANTTTTTTTQTNPTETTSHPAQINYIFHPPQSSLRQTPSPAATAAPSAPTLTTVRLDAEAKWGTKRAREAEVDSVSEGPVAKRAKCGKIVQLRGPMFACKTTSLRAFARRYALAKKHCLIVKYAKDTRYSKDTELITHDMVRLPASCMVERLADIPADLLESSDVILVDEAHFYEDLVQFCTKSAQSGKIVVAAGLVSTWDQKPFTEMCNLAAHADEIVTLKAVCTVCGEDAIYTKRIVPSTKLQLIGGENLYAARCRHCHPLP